MRMSIPFFLSSHAQGKKKGHRAPFLSPKERQEKDRDGEEKTREPRLLVLFLRCEEETV